MKRRLVMLAMLALSVGVFMAAPDTARCAKAAPLGSYGSVPADYCYVFTVTVTNTSAGTLTDYAVRVPINASGLISAGQMDAEAWDAYPAYVSFSQEGDLLAQGLSSATAPWWWHVRSISNGQSRQITLYFGASDIARDQGVLFTGSDVVSAAHHPDYNISDALTLDVTLEHLSGAAMNATLASHWSASTGYRLLLIDSGGTLKIRGQVDGQTCDVTWNSAWTNTNRLVTMTFNNPNLVIAVDGATQNTCNTGLATISSVSTTFDVGTSLSRAIIRDVRLRSGSTPKLHWGFDPLTMAETSAVNPTYSGTVTDESGNAHTGTYTFTRTQTGLSYSVGPVYLASNAPDTAPASDNTDVLGDNIFGRGIGATPEVTGDLFHSLVSPSVDAFTGPRVLAWTLIFVLMSLAFMVGAYLLLGRYIPLAVLIGGVPLVYAATKGYMPYWALMLWALFAISAWFAVRRGESSF